MLWLWFFATIWMRGVRKVHPWETDFSQPSASSGSSAARPLHPWETESVASTAHPWESESAAHSDGESSDSDDEPAATLGESLVEFATSLYY